MILIRIFGCLDFHPTTGFKFWLELERVLQEKFVQFKPVEVGRPGKGEGAFSSRQLCGQTLLSYHLVNVVTTRLINVVSVRCLSTVYLLCSYLDRRYQDNHDIWTVTTLCLGLFVGRSVGWWVGGLIGWSVCHNFLNGLKVRLPFSYRSTCLNN